MHPRERLKPGDVDRDGELAIADLTGRFDIGTGHDDVVASNEGSAIDRDSREK